MFEAQITRVDFSGDAGPYDARLEELASDLSLRVPLRTADLQTALQAMRELPGLTVRASTRRDESRRNSYALTIATEYKPFDASVQLSNRGTREIGPMFAISQVVANSLLGWRERLGVFASAATDPDEYQRRRRVLRRAGDRSGHASDDDRFQDAVEPDRGSRTATIATIASACRCALRAR